MCHIYDLTRLGKEADAFGEERAPGDFKAGNKRKKGGREEKDGAHRGKDAARSLCNSKSLKDRSATSSQTNKIVCDETGPMPHLNPGA